MDATLGGHSDSATAGVVRAFLAEQQDYPVRLRRIILQSADDLFRAAEGDASLNFGRELREASPYSLFLQHPVHE